MTHYVNDCWTSSMLNQRWGEKSLGLVDQLSKPVRKKRKRRDESEESDEIKKADKKLL